ncbi:MAG: hypothetical protein CME64_08135 [Halobacteriovoraceae bacterium]|nr:hypothetical protein [Halobacteriovoraceae bacterium]|tara:strand:+ start:895 stop:1122 length:228 start_codon:yes stop_codon:yes gene_type:complete
MEKLKVDQQKEIIDGIIDQLRKENLDLYYVDSSTIAKMVWEKIHGEGFNRKELEIVEHLSSEDILTLMSYHTNCC